MSALENPFLLPPPPPPERTAVLRVILLLSAIAHVVVLALFWRTPAESAPPPRRGDMVRVLRGEVTENTADPGLRLRGYADVPAPSKTEQ